MEALDSKDNWHLLLDIFSDVNYQILYSLHIDMKVISFLAYLIISPFIITQYETSTFLLVSQRLAGFHIEMACRPPPPWSGWDYATGEL